MPVRRFFYLSSPAGAVGSPLRISKKLSAKHNFHDRFDYRPEAYPFDNTIAGAVNKLKYAFVCFFIFKKSDIGIYIIRYNTSTKDFREEEFELERNPSLFPNIF